MSSSAMAGERIRQAVMKVHEAPPAARSGIPENDRPL
jgi:hypothetical protein